MLTPLRPETQLDEDIFTRLIELDRLRMQTRKMEKKESAGLGKKDPDRTIKLPGENKGGVREIYTKICDDCGEEFCYGTCNKFQYEDFKRLEPKEETYQEN